MEIRCPSCNQRYDLEPQALSQGSARVVCSLCNKHFRVQLAATEAPAWLLRKHHDGSVLPLDGLVTLQRWIVERRALPQDEISRTGKQWKPLSAIRELNPFFAVVDELSRAKNAVSVEESLEAMARSAPDRATGPVRLQDENTSSENPFAELFASIESEDERKPEDELAQADTDAPSEELAAALLETLSVEQPKSSKSEKDPPSLTLIMGSSAEPKEQVLTLTPAPSKPSAPRFGETGASWFEADNAPLVLPSPSKPLELSELEPDFRPQRRGLKAALALLLLSGLAAGSWWWLSRTPTPKDTTPAQETIAPEQTSSPAPTPPSDALQNDAPAIEAPRIEYKYEARHLDGASLAIAGRWLRNPQEEQADPSELLKNADRLRSKGRYDEALAAYNEVLAQQSRNSRAHAGAGWCYLSMGNASDAVDAFSEAIDLNESLSSAYIGLAKAFDARGEGRAALSIYERYLRLFPSGPEASIAREQAKRLQEKFTPAAPPPTPTEPPETAPKPPSQPPETAPKPPSQPPDTPPSEAPKVIIIREQP
ncbi:MAG: tetratricopeptide repeat protein [Myxococcota bacterium]|jgi:tetratricopeptide (TPR) repeat protein|nr:tetratricopeptide repeat protein [Myxococcota bacterium]